MLLQQRLVAHAGELEQLRGVDRPAAEDHFAGIDRVTAARPLVVDADRPLTLEPDAGHQGEGADGEVLPVPDRVEVGPRGGEPAAAVDVAVEPREALLPVAVHVVGEVVAGLDRRAEERVEERVGRRAPLELERAVAAAPVVGAGQAVLHPLEVGQAVEVVPLLHPRLPAPSLVVERVAALEDHPVDAARATEYLAARVEDPPAAQVRLGVSLVLPVVEPAADRERQRGRHVDERVDPVVRPARLEDEDAGVGVGREAVGEGAASGTATDDDVVVTLLNHCSPPLPGEPALLGRPDVVPHVLGLPVLVEACDPQLPTGA